MENPLTQKNSSPTVSFMPPKTIVLVGLMGCGKTSIGKRLAKKLDIPFHDSDQAVEESAGCPIKDIFDIYGEDAFRVGEQKVIERLLGQPTHILATGGGSFANEPTRKVILDKSISIWLKADLDTLTARVSRRTDRPMLGGPNQREVLEQLIAERYPVYAEANIHVDTMDEPTNCTVDRVIQAMTDYIRTNYPSYYVLKSL